MFHAPGSYLQSTRHPWSSMLFVVPLLLLYEVGLLLLDVADPEVLRNGADTWLRGCFASFGLHGPFWAPTLLLVVFGLWCVLEPSDPPEDYSGAVAGIFAESFLFALGLWGLSRILWPLLQFVGVEFALVSSGSSAVCQTPIDSTTATDPLLGQVLGYVGAGVYEESLFRLFLFSSLLWMLRKANVAGRIAFVPAALASAVLFAAAHHMGPHGEIYDDYVFLFRTIAGIYFALLFHFRGFGIAVGAHTFYDLLVAVVFRGL